MLQPNTNRILIVSSCTADWGGSEELWAKAALLLQAKGMQVIVYKSEINRSHPEFQNLQQKGILLEDWRSVFSTGQRGVRKINRAIDMMANRKNSNDFWRSHTDEAFIKTIGKYKPSLIVVAQGINFDGLHHAHQSLSAQIPYVIISQKAVDFYWPPCSERPLMTNALLGAKKCFFVSQHNLRLTEEQFGTRLPDSGIVFNPVKIVRKISYPSNEKGYKLACIARLFILDKGQDMLLRILSKPKWKNRPLSISFVGEGQDMEGLRGMAALLGLDNIEFTGQISDIEKIWQKHHALILPSRSEGLPLSIVEAMSAGRPVIVTNAGGNGELIEEGITGFIGQANEDALDQAMERAWEKRDMWEAIGDRASAYVREKIPGKPENDFAEYLNTIVNE